MDKKLFHFEILKWYEKCGRQDLPWRCFDKAKNDERLKGINTAYGVYISEIMLQQTQVSRVLEHFYFPFLQKFPTLKSLAEADEDEILKAWQGLGYYSRARNLRLCAKECVEKFKGFLPSKMSELAKLKGIGTYTAGAIACFGYKQAVSFVDANIKRLFSRLFALENPTQKELEALAQKLLCKENAFDYHQALIDLGALICTAKVAKCGICPLYTLCKGKNEALKYPQNKKINYERLNLNLLVAFAGQKVALQKSTTKLYKGLYNLPQIDDEKAKECEFVGEFKHSYTKYRLTVRVYSTKKPLKDCEFVPLSNLCDFALSNLALKALNCSHQARKKMKLSADYNAF